MGYSLEDLLGENSSFTNMSTKEKEYFSELLREEMLRRDESSKPEQIRDIVPVEQWITSPYYVGKDVNLIYPYWKDLVVDIFRADRKPEESINQVILSGAIGIGKSCLVETTKIPTSLGLLSLKELYDRFHNKRQRFQVQSESIWKDCIDVYDNGIAETKIITMKSGRKVQSTLNHKYRVVRDDTIEWVKTSELHIGDTFVMTHKETPFGKVSMSSDEAYILGRSMKELDTKGSDTKFPKVIFECDKGTVCNFIRGLMDSVGVVDSEGVIKLILQSKEFIDSVASLLSMLGINYNLSIISNSGSGNSYKLQIVDNRSYFIYQKCIGFDIDYKRHRLQQYCDRIRKEEQLIDINSTNSEYLTYLSENDVFFDKVDSIDDGGKVHTMDLTIDTDHSYCFDGFISHNTVAEIIMLRKLYEMSCWKNINARYQLMSKTNIMFLYFSVNKVQAERTGFGEIRSWIDNSPYFKDEFPRRDRIKEALMFPEGLTFVYGSGSQHSIGMSVIGTIMDEANFSGGANGVGNTEKASELYAGIVNRANSRFILDGGINHSLNILISSSTTESSVTERQILASKDDPHTLVCAPSQWEVKPQKFSKTFFYVCKGTNYLEPYIVRSADDINNFRLSEGLPKEKYVDGNEDFAKIDAMVRNLPPHQQAKFLRVPVDLKMGFETNIMKSLQDLGGVSIGSQGKLFSSVVVYNACVDPRFKHPFIQPSITVATGDNVEIKDFLRADFRLRHPERPRYIHIDQSTTTDDTGISCVYVDEVLEEDGVKKPIFGVDFMLQINPPKPPRKIAIYKIRNFVVWLSNVMNMSIGKVTYDIFNSEESRQILEEMGFNVGYQSVDRSDKAYLDTVEIMYEGRLRMYDYSVFRKEIFNVVHYRDRHKVDHLKTNADGCFLGNTRIKCLDDTNPTIEELVDREDLELYGCLCNGKVVPTKAKRVWKTKDVYDYLRITLDNGEVIECTENHRFMLRDGSYKEAKNLLSTDSLMSLHYDFEGKFLKGYDRCVVCHSDTNKLEKFNHRIISIEKVYSNTPIPVYDIEVPSTHNFALSSGVFVHNSVGKKDVADSLVGSIENAISFKVDESASGGSHIQDFLTANSLDYSDIQSISVEDMIDRQIDQMIDSMEDGTGTILW